ncbi:MAG: transporter related [Eubacterium sp.]|jgi:energy-coupling factor transport system ATP-binding protein|nr:transporter related [Eubacterium sp.]
MIEFKQVSFSYGSEKTDNSLYNINLTVKDGEFILLCGGSGCGKTTLTRLVNGLIPNYYEGKLEGKVLVDGVDVSRMPLYEMAGMVGSVFQNPRSQFFNVDTTGELAFGCENMGLPVKEIHARIKRTAKDLYLKHLLDRSIFALSGGEKQKIACGSVAALEPRIYVLDEPSSNLDVCAVEELRNLLAHWKSQGKTVVIAEHRLYYLHELADRVIYMKDGQIEREYSGKEFSAMGRMELESLGLRILSMEHLKDSFVPEKKKQ